MFEPKITTVATKTLPIEGHDAAITIKHIKSGQMQSIDQDSMVTEYKQGQSGMEIGLTVNSTKKSRAIVTACVSGWEGFKDVNNKPLKFSALNLMKMIDESKEFVDFVVEEHDKFASEIESEKEEEEKN